MEVSVFRVSDMMGHHCGRLIEKTVRRVSGVDNVEIDLDAKTLKVYGDASVIDIIRAVSLVGYTINFIC